jgi:anti-anti-sigma regulatory factor
LCRNRIDCSDDGQAAMHTYSSGELTVLTPVGDLDLTTYEELSVALTRALADSRVVVVDLVGVDAIDMTGAWPLIAARRDLAPGRRLVLAQPSLEVEAMLAVLRLTDLVVPVEVRPDAVRCRPHISDPVDSVVVQPDTAGDFTTASLLAR